MAIAVVYLLAWALLDLLSRRFQVAEEVRVWYPPAGLDVVLLLVFGLRYSPLLALNTLVHAGLSKPDLSIGQLAIFGVITTSSYTGAAWVLLRRLRIDPRLTHQSDVIWLVLVAALAAPLAVAIGQVLLFSAAGLLAWSSFVTNALSHWAGDSTGHAEPVLARGLATLSAPVVR